MNAELFGAFVDGKSGGVRDGGGRLGDDLDGNEFVGYEVLGTEDHAEGSMVEWRDDFVSSIEHSTFFKLIAHALHEGYLTDGDEELTREVQRLPGGGTRWRVGECVMELEAGVKVRDQTKGSTAVNPQSDVLMHF